MRMLAIETSCDETAVAIVEGTGDEKSATFKVLGNALLSQTIHAQYGGVFPALAKREHAKNLVPILEAALEEAELLREDTQALAPEARDEIAQILAREPGLAEAFFAFITETEPAAVDAIAVTSGPGLEPALWVGINFAKALARAWDKPLLAINHMEGHLIAALASGNHVAPSSGDNDASEEFSISNVQFPMLALLISGGHTELVLMKEWLTYKLLGQTRDDAVGEAYDKVARMLALPYPGGPEVSRLAELSRTAKSTPSVRFPRPMLDSNSCDFSFAGLKTAVLYLLKERGQVSEEEKQHIAHEFENAVADVLWAKTARALEESGAETLVIGGGVSANAHIRRTFTENIQKEFAHVALRIPSSALTTDNAIMIGLAGFYRALRGGEYVSEIKAEGNLSLAKQ
jgi:N6-L-threonylcarbamoyladenine synthase